jgi:hypothetical protein
MAFPIKMVDGPFLNGVLLFEIESLSLIFSSILDLFVEGDFVYENCPFSLVKVTIFESLSTLGIEFSTVCLNVMMLFSY